MDDTAPRVSPADSLAVRLILFAVLLVVVTAALIGGLAYTRARHALEREARTRLTIIARNVAQSLDREIADRESDLASWAHLAVMRAVMYDDVDKELAQFIRQILTGGLCWLLPGIPNMFPRTRFSVLLQRACWRPTLVMTPPFPSNP